MPPPFPSGDRREQVPGVRLGDQGSRSEGEERRTRGDRLLQGVRGEAREEIGEGLIGAKLEAMRGAGSGSFGAGAIASRGRNGPAAGRSRSLARVAEGFR